MCCGKKTEPNYINSLVRFANQKSDKSPIITKCISESKSPSQLVEDVSNHTSNAGILYAKIFVVFDKDDFTNDDFNKAISNCYYKEYIPIWSNQSIELWFMLHFNYVTTNIGTEGYFDKLPKIFRKLKDYEYVEDGYNKSEDIFKLINTPNNLKKAFNNAMKRLKDTDTVKSPAKRYSCTNFPDLIKSIEEELSINLTK